jgi:hypothetical protein
MVRLQRVSCHAFESEAILMPNRAEHEKGVTLRFPRIPIGGGDSDA